MSENEVNQDGAEQGANSDLSEALSDGDESFVTEGEGTPKNKKSMIVLGVLLAGLVGYFGYSKVVPKGESVAAAPPSAQTLEADKTITTFLSAGSDSIKSMQQLLQNTSRIVEQFRSYPLFTQVPLNDLKTNPFKWSGGKQNDKGEETPNLRKREQERQAALKAVQGLQLQSIMFGEARRACMINNALCTEGQQVDAFVIEKITQGAVIVRSGTYRFELKMQQK
jgi:hypothetical protein